MLYKENKKMTRWVAVPQRVNNPPQVSFVVPMTAEAATTQLAYMEGKNRMPNIMAAKEAYNSQFSPFVVNAFDMAMQKAKDVKNAYLMNEAVTYLIITIVIIVMLMFIK